MPFFLSARFYNETWGDVEEEGKKKTTWITKREKELPQSGRV